MDTIKKVSLKPVILSIAEVKVYSCKDIDRDKEDT